MIRPVNEFMQGTYTEIDQRIAEMKYRFNEESRMELIKTVKKKRT